MVRTLIPQLGCDGSQHSIRVIRLVRQDPPPKGFTLFHFPSSNKVSADTE